MSTLPASDEMILPVARYTWPRLTWLAILLLLIGLALVIFGDSGQVETVRVTHTGLMIPAVLSPPDYYVAILLKDGTRTDTASYNDVPIGGGLNFLLPEPVSLSDIAQVVLYDNDLVGDDMLDRADVTGRKCDGQSYSFELMGSQSRLFPVGIVLSVLGGLYLVYAIVTFLRAHAL